MTNVPIQHREVVGQTSQEQVLIWKNIMIWFIVKRDTRQHMI